MSSQLLAGRSEVVEFGSRPDPVLRLGQGEEGCVLAGRIVRCCFYGTNMIDADLKGTSEVGFRVARGCNRGSGHGGMGEARVAEDLLWRMGGAGGGRRQAGAGAV